ncbi:hypothetical protein [Nostoc sp. DSM 114160]
MSRSLGTLRRLRTHEPEAGDPKTALPHEWALTCLGTWYWVLGKISLSFGGGSKPPP